MDFGDATIDRRIHHGQGSWQMTVTSVWRIFDAQSGRTDTIRAPRCPGVEGRSDARAGAWPGADPRQGRGVGPTDLKIRRGEVRFARPPDAILGFEAAGVVDTLGPSVSGIEEGDEVASLLPALGGYGEYALASSWTPKPPEVTWGDAAALPASAEAAVGTLKQLGLTGGETLLVLGAAGSVGMIATQLAVFRGATVVGAAASRDHNLVRDLGAVPVSYGPGLADRVRQIVPSVHAVLDAAGKGGLPDAIDLAGVQRGSRPSPMSTPPTWASPSPYPGPTVRPKPSIRPCRSWLLVLFAFVASGASLWSTRPRRTAYSRTAKSTRSSSLIPHDPTRTAAPLGVDKTTGPKRAETEAQGFIKVGVTLCD
jgi:Alcohol dehydrogenase GroES-like domain